MAQQISELKELLDKLKVSSNFSAGDAGSFRIEIIKGSLGLPGKYGASDYFDALQLPDITDTTVAVVFPGTGGLCVEALVRGATNVWAFEPREHHHKALAIISDVTLRALGKSFSIISNARWLSQRASAPKFDTIIWSEGLEQSTQPLVALEYVSSLLASGGSLFIEVVHGQQDSPGATINSWRPKEAVFMKEAAKIFKDATFKAMRGRLDRRIIYKITLPETEEEEIEETTESDKIEEGQLGPKPKKISFKKKR